MTKSTEFKISEDAARAQLDELYSYYEIETEAMPEPVQAAIKVADAKLLKAIRLGRVEIEINEKNVISVTHNLQHGDPLTYREIDGAAKVAMGTKEDRDSYGRAYALMGALCGLGEKAITQLKSRDLAIVESLGILFLQA